MSEEKFVLFSVFILHLWHEVFCFEPQTNLLSLFLPETICRLSAYTALRINSNYTYETPPEKVQPVQIIPYNIVTPPPPYQSRDYLPRFIFMDPLYWGPNFATKKDFLFSFSQSYQNVLMISRSRQQHERNKKMWRIQNNVVIQQVCRWTSCWCHTWFWR